MGGVDTAPEMERMTDMRVYADQAATTSLSKTALEAMQFFVMKWISAVTQIR